MPPLRRFEVTVMGARTVWGYYAYTEAEARAMARRDGGVVVSVVEVFDVDPCRLAVAAPDGEGHQ